MAVTTQVFNEDAVSTVGATRHRGANLKEIRVAVSQLSNRITNRDEKIMEVVRELKVMSLNQVHRIFWPHAQEVTAYNRLCFLVKNFILDAARKPDDSDFEAWGLPACNVYTLGPGGEMWLKTEVNEDLSARQLRREQVLHDLLVSELYIRMVEAVAARGENWTIAWAGEGASSFYDNGRQPLIAPDGLAIIRRQVAGKTAVLSLFIEMDKGRQPHAKPSSDWGRKVHGYDRFHENWRMHPQLSNIPSFPWVAVVTHGAQRLLNLAEAIVKHKKAGIVYFLALWDDLAGADILTAPAWLVVTPEGKIVGRASDQRRPLVQEQTGGA